MTKKILKYITAHKVIAGVVVVVLIIAGYYTYTRFSNGTTATQYVFGKVQRGDLVVSVSGTGQVATLSKVEIKPQTTGQSQTLGQIIKVNVVNGQTVKAGDVIAILDGKTALQAVNQAKSSVTSAQANYDKLVGSTTGSGSRASNNSIQSAQLNLQNSIQNIATKLQSDYISVSTLVFLNTDPLFVDPVVNPVLTIDGTYFTDQSLQTKVQNERIQVGFDLVAIKNDASNVLTSSDPTTAVNDAMTRFTGIRNYFDDMTTLLSMNTKAVSSSGQSNLDSDKSMASNARLGANSVVTDMVNALQTYQGALISLNQVTASYPDDLAVAQAQLDNANANLSTAEQTYASRIITAPFDGQIGGLTAQLGQQVSSSDVLGTIITAQKVVNVSLNEVDAAKVAAGDTVTLTFDALPDLTLQGVVSYLDPLGTVSQGVVNYSVQIGINDQNNQIKTGMTATAIIITETHSNVLIVPTAAITKVGNQSVVLVPNASAATPAPTASTSNSYGDFARFASSTATSTASSTRPRGSGNRTFGSTTVATQSAAQATTATVHAVPVAVGISNDTSTEILSGLNEGDTIVTRTIKGTTSTTAASTAQTGSIFGIGGGGGTVRTGTGGRIGG
jgi:HlyD family secretion protein